MAKPSWLTIVPMQGSGNQVVNNSSVAYTGRIMRSGIVTVTGKGMSETKTYKVNQSALAEFVNYDNGTEMAVAVEGGVVTITGVSNSSKLAFDWVIPEGSTEPEIDSEGGTSTGGVNYPTVSIPTKYLAGGAETTNASAINGDPGATGAFAFSIALDFPLNDAVVDVYRTLQVKANGNQVAQIQLKQTAGSPRLEVSLQEITIPQDGSAVTVNITSNTDWNIS